MPQKKGQPIVKIGTDMGLPLKLQPSFRLKDAPARELQVVDHSGFQSIIDVVRQKRDGAGASEAAGSEAGGGETTGGEAADGEAAAGEAAGGEAAGGAAADAPAHNTRGGPVPIERFSDSKHSSFSEYELGRLGARHDRVRDMSYAEATQKLEDMGLQAEAWLQEVRSIITQMDVILSEIPEEQQVAVSAMQEALMEMIGEAEGDDEAEDGDGGQCEQCDPMETSDAKQTEEERVAAAYFEEVQEAVGWSTEGAPPSPPLAVLRASRNGCAGGLLLTRFELLWVKVGGHYSQADFRVCLREIERASPSLLKSPFGSRADLTISARGQAPERFECGSALADVEMFSLELATAAGAIP
eukprot:7388790-Prymnesium_polylepis.1